MSFDSEQKALALEFARALAGRAYSRAHGMLSANAREEWSEGALREQFETMIPLDWGEVNPIALEENPAWDGLFVYVVLGGGVYSEAVIVSAFVSETGMAKIEQFQFGRP